MPYVYLLKWTSTNTKYYGVRYSKYATPEDLGATYFSSSKYVRQHIKAHGYPDIIQVRKIFDTGDYEVDKSNALRWENKVLERMQVVHRSDYLNKWDNNMVPKKLCGPFPFEDIKIQEKVNKTLISKYGTRGSGSAAIKRKIFETNIKKYNTYHTLHCDSVAQARKRGSIEKFGTDNPFKNPEKLKEVMLERYGITNMMHDPATKEKHALAMKNADWTSRNEKNKKHSRACPYGCKDKHIFTASNFTNHMKKIHKWSPEQIREYKNENPTG